MATKTKATAQGNGMTKVVAEELAIDAAVLDMALTGYFEEQKDGALDETHAMHVRVGIDTLLHKIRTGLANAAK